MSGFYTVTDSEIRGRNGSLFLFSGLLEHTIDSIKSFEGVDFVWVEEAHSVSRNLFSKLSKKSDHALNASDLRECIG